MLMVISVLINIINNLIYINLLQQFFSRKVSWRVQVVTVDHVY